jgi:hypothetical protein
MSGTNKNFVVAYAFLVVLPLLGLAGILNYGRRLTAPLSVDGVWHFETGFNELAHLLCVKADVPIHDGSVVISQSGKVLALNVSGQPRPAAMGSIEGNNITASISLPAGSRQSAGCRNDRQLTLSATVTPDADPRFLVAVLTLKDCASCTPVEFHAVRQVRATKEEY